MRSMLKEEYEYYNFYKYLASKIINFFIETNLTNGQKFFLDLDKKNQVNYFFNVLKYLK